MKARPSTRLWLNVRRESLIVFLRGKMIDTKEKAGKATREELVQFLKEWGFKCGFSTDSLKDLRALVQECLKNKMK